MKKIEQPVQLSKGDNDRVNIPEQHYRRGIAAANKEEFSLKSLCPRLVVYMRESRREIISFLKSLNSNTNKR